MILKGTTNDPGRAVVSFSPPPSETMGGIRCDLGAEAEPSAGEVVLRGHTARPRWRHYRRRFRGGAGSERLRKIRDMVRWIGQVDCS